MLKEVVLALACATAPQAEPKLPDSVALANDVTNIVQAANLETQGTLDGLGLLWVPCGMMNGFYDPGMGAIFECLENVQDPGYARFVAAHETGHALVDLLHLPVDESPVAQEVAADELGVLLMVDQDRREDIQAAAIAHLSFPEPPAGDEHPENRARAYHLMCLEDGSEEHPAALWCKVLYDEVRAKWSAALSDAIQLREQGILPSPPDEP